MAYFGDTNRPIVHGWVYQTATDGQHYSNLQLAPRYLIDGWWEL